MNAQKLSLIIALAVLIVPTVVSETVEVEPFNPLTPRAAGMGSPTLAAPKGRETLWTNPAGFAVGKRSFTLFAIGASALGNPADVMDALSADVGDAGEMLSALEPVITKSGAGFNIQGGLAWVGKRIGVGLNLDADAYVYGRPFPLGTEGYVDSTVALSLGYAHPIKLTDSITVAIGAAVHPSLKYRAELDGELIEMLVTEDDQADAIIEERLESPAWGFPIDVGVHSTLPLGFSASVVVSDLNGRYRGGASDDEYLVPWSVGAGVAWHPNLGPLKWLIDPTITADVTNVNLIVNEETSVWKELHLGIEVATLKQFITLWAGLNAGYPSFGAEIDLFVIDVGVAYTTTEKGRYLGDRPVTSVTVEVAIRLD